MRTNKESCCLLKQETLLGLYSHAEAKIPRHSALRGWHFWSLKGWWSYNKTSKLFLDDKQRRLDAFLGSHAGVYFQLKHVVPQCKSLFRSSSDLQHKTRYNCWTPKRNAFANKLNTFAMSETAARLIKCDIGIRNVNKYINLSETEPIQFFVSLDDERWESW